MVYPRSLTGARYGEPPLTARACDNKVRIPSLVAITPFTTKKLFGTCAKRSPFGISDPGKVIAAAVARAIEMLDNTIGELVNARSAVCAGQTPAWPLLGDVTLEWLRNRLGVCTDDIGVWTAGTLVNRSVAEVIRRLTRVRNLIASNAIMYVCHGPLCDGRLGICSHRSYLPSDRAHYHSPMQEFLDRHSGSEDSRGVSGPNHYS